MQEEFAHAASLYAPAAAAALEADVDDMFADEEPAAFGAGKPEAPSTAGLEGTDRPGGGGAGGVTEDTRDAAATQGQAAAPSIAAAAAAAAQPAAEAVVDFDSWPIKELRRFLAERGEVKASTQSLLWSLRALVMCWLAGCDACVLVQRGVMADGLCRGTLQDANGIVEKSDLVVRVKELAAKGPEGEVAAAPDGYVFDPASGLYHDGADMYYDSSAQKFYSASTQQWYSYDAATGWKAL
jgi:OCRE domain